LPLCFAARRYFDAFASDALPRIAATINMLLYTCDTMLLSAARHMSCARFAPRCRVFSLCAFVALARRDAARARHAELIRQRALSCCLLIFYGICCI